MGLTFRSTLSQILATSAKNILLVNIAMYTGFAQLVVGTIHNASEGLSLDDNQVSWMSSLQFFCQPASSVLSGLVVQRFGRKAPMMLLSVPGVTAWLLLGLGGSPGYLLVAAALSGVFTGLAEAPTKTYAGEVCEPKLRGSLTAFTSLFFSTGKGLMPLLGAAFHWQSIALASVVIPVSSFLAISMIPESPHWLASRGRMEEAERSLRWLRGWTTSSEVEEELKAISKYCPAATEQAALEPLRGHEEKEKTSAKEELKRLLRDFTMPETWRPLAFVVTLFLLTTQSHGAAMLTYYISVMKKLQVPYSVYWIAAVHNSVGAATCVALMVLLPVAGKRKLCLASALGLCASHGVTALHATAPRLLPAWTPLASTVMASVFYNLGMLPIPWILLSEIFPLRTRGVASGLAASLKHLMLFATFRTYLSMEYTLGVHGVFWFYAASSLVAFVFLFLCMPETEGRTLQQVEDFFKSGRLPAPKDKMVLRDA